MRVLCDKMSVIPYWHSVCHHSSCRHLLWMFDIADQRIYVIPDLIGDLKWKNIETKT